MTAPKGPNDNQPTGFVAVVPYREAYDPNGNARAKLEKENSDLNKLEACARDLAKSVIGDNAQVVTDKRSPEFRMILEVKAPDNQEPKGFFSRIANSATSLVAPYRANMFQFSIDNSAAANVRMNVIHRDGDAASETLKQVAAYIDLTGTRIQSPGGIQMGQIGDINPIQKAAIDHQGVSAVKNLRDCMKP